MQAIHYQPYVEQYRRMVKTPSPAEIAMAAFAQNTRVRMAALGVTSDRDLYRMVVKRAEVSEKTVNNALNARHDSKIGTLNAVAESLGLPVWVLLIPELPPELLQEPDAHRVVRLVQHFIASNGEGRSHIENIAAAAAYQSRKQ